MMLATFSVMIAAAPYNKRIKKLIPALAHAVSRTVAMLLAYRRCTGARSKRGNSG